MKEQMAKPLEVDWESKKVIFHDIAHSLQVSSAPYLEWLLQRMRGYYSGQTGSKKEGGAILHDGAEKAVLFLRSVKGESDDHVTVLSIGSVLPVKWKYTSCQVEARNSSVYEIKKKKKKQ